MTDQPRPLQPTPEGLLVVEGFQVNVARMLAKLDTPTGVETEEQLALVLTLRGHENHVDTETRVVAALTTEGAAKLTGWLLEALDTMREPSGSTPE